MVTVDPRIANAAESLLALIAENLHDAVLITEGEAGPSGSRLILYVNRAFTAMTGFSEEEALARSPDLTIGPLTDRATLAQIQAARAARVPIRVELLKYRKDGSTFWAELDVLPVLNDGGRCTHFIGVLRDTTERRLANEALARAARAAEMTNLVSGLAHEINNPLAALLTNLEWMARRIPTEDARVFGEAQEAATRIASIVRQLRSLVDPEPREERSPSPKAEAQARARVLIVDDDELVLRSIGRVIAKHHEVTMVQSAALALVAMSEQAAPFDAVLCDLTMPGIDGLAFYERVRSLGRQLERRIIFMTGGPTGALGQSATLAELPNQCIEKPLDTPALLAAIEAVARKTQP